MTKPTQRFDVGIKALLMSGSKLLVVRDANSGRWEFPGGRIDVGEETTPTEKILQRELSEELGTDIQYVIGRPVAAWSVMMAGQRAGDYVFLIGFQCDLLSGTIQLSDEHKEYQWVDEQSWQKLEFVPGYQQVIRNFWKQE